MSLAARPLVCRISNYSQSEEWTLDFNDPEGPWYIEEETEDAAILANGDIQETFVLVAAETNTSFDFAYQQQELIHIFKEINASNHPLNPLMFYLEFYLNPGEEPKRYIIKSARIVSISAEIDYSRFRHEKQTSQKLVIELIRSPIPEEIAPTSHQFTNVENHRTDNSAIGIEPNHSADTRLSIARLIYPGGNAWNKIYMGIKPIRGDGETTSNSDYAGRSWMNISTTTNFAANPNMTRYYYQSIYDLAGGFPVDMTHFYGKFRLLVHVTCPSGTEATIQAAFGHPYHTTLADKRLFVLEPVYIDSNYPYNFLDLGTIQIPLQKLNEQFIATALPTEAAYHDEYDNLRVSIWAQRVAGSGELTFDHLVFMPFEHSIEIGDIETEQPYDRIAIAELSTRELIAQQFYHKQGSLSVDARNWYIPKSGGILKVLIDSQSGNVSTAYTLELETRAIW